MHTTMESTERISGEQLSVAEGATSLFTPDNHDDDNSSEVDIFTKDVMVSPTEEQFTILHNKLRERLLQGETIYDIGTGGRFTFIGYNVKKS